jgi:alpha-beta hydrolase superfamily lysophospholipase
MNGVGRVRQAAEDRFRRAKEAIIDDVLRQPAITMPAASKNPTIHDGIVAADGVRLHVQHWLPADAPRAVVLAIHGLNDYANGFAAVGAALARDGIAVVTYDQRGFGRARDRGRWPGDAALVADTLFAVRLLREAYSGLPVYLMGESMGAAVAVLAAVQGAAADGYILLAPAVWGRSLMGAFERAGLWLGSFFPALEWSPQALPVQVRASDNAAMLRALEADPLVIKTTRSDSLNGLVDLMSMALEAAPRFRAPALILYGARDEIVPRAAVARFVAALPPEENARQRIALYENGYHLLTRDLNGAAVIDDIRAWLADPSAMLPSGADRGARESLARRAAPQAALQFLPLLGTWWRP